MKIEALPVARKVAIFGTGSIACRHSRVLHRLGFIIDAFTDREGLVDLLDFENNFSHIYGGQWGHQYGDYDFYVIAKITSKHKEVYDLLIKSGINKNKIFCEKPGSEEVDARNILFNLRYLDIPWADLGSIEKLVHRANARLWPSSMPWRSRYMFRKSMGGGATLTNSHEIDILAQRETIKEVMVRNVIYQRDIDGALIDCDIEFVVDGIPVELSIVDGMPVRYWQFENYIIKFYGEIPHPFNRQIVVVSSEMIDKSYESMWRDIIANKIDRFKDVNLTNTLYRKFL